MRYTRTRIGIDIDGVLAKFNPTAIKFAIDNKFIKKAPSGSLEEPDQWEWCDNLPSEFWKKFSERKMWLELEPYKENIEELIKLSKRNLNRIYIITSRKNSEDIKEQTLEWLDKFNILNNVEDVIFSKQKHKEASKIPLNYMLDDNYHFLENFLVYVDFCTPVLVTRRYNKGIFFPNRVKNLHEFALRFKL